MENSNKHKSYEWYLLFTEITRQASPGVKCPSYVNEKNMARVRWDEREKQMRGIVIRMFK